MTPTDIKLHQKSRNLEVQFDTGESFLLPCEYLRVFSPSAEVRGHGAGELVLVPGKKYVNIIDIAPVGHYAVRLGFDDGHDSGLYTWQTLYDLGREMTDNWQQYLDRLERAGLSREPETSVGHFKPDHE